MYCKTKQGVYITAIHVSQTKESYLKPGRRGGERRGLGPRNDVLTTCKVVTLRGGQQIIALFPKPAEEIRNA